MAQSVYTIIYGLDERGYIPGRDNNRIFSSPPRPGRFWGPPSLLSNEYRASYLWGKVPGAWSWPFTSI